MLEVDQALATWRLGEDLLEISPGAEVDAIKIHDHRKAYLDYTGEVNRDRGRVDPQDAGQLNVVSCDEGLWTFELSGAVLQGRFELRRIPAGRDSWTLREIMDQ
jgi:hypothetical protein